MTLVELSNTNNELLKRLSEVAPGTFQHSMQVANLATEVANKIGAKALLVRTGALYHDIGKMNSPAYFTENQNNFNPHDRISYEQSAAIVISHVKDGLKLADKYNLPQVIKGFHLDAPRQRQDQILSDFIQEPESGPTGRRIPFHLPRSEPVHAGTGHLDDGGLCGSRFQKPERIHGREYQRTGG